MRFLLRVSPQRRPGKYTALIVQVTSGYSDAFNELLDAYMQIGMSFPPLAQYTHVVRISPASQKWLAYIFEEVLELHQKLLRLVKQRGTLKFLR